VPCSARAWYPEYQAIKLCFDVDSNLEILGAAQRALAPAHQIGRPCGPQPGRTSARACEGVDVPKLFEAGLRFQVALDDRELELVVLCAKLSRANQNPSSRRPAYLDRAPTFPRFRSSSIDLTAVTVDFGEKLEK
jgi:hypothetical protein